MESSKQINKKKLLICMSLIAIAILVFVVVQIVSFFNLDTNEKRALRCVEDLQSRLKVDDSLILKSDILVFMCDTSEYKEYEPYTFFVMFDYSAKNSLGVQVNNTAIYNGHSYFASVDNNADDFEAYEDKQDFTCAMFAYYSFRANGEDLKSDRVLSFHIVDGKLIARHVGCKYSK